MPDGNEAARLDDLAARRAAGFDLPRIEAAIREILYAIGEDPDREGLVDTPRRVARAYKEVFSGLATDPGTHLAPTFGIEHDELVLVREIEVNSTCEHHLVPFMGVARRLHPRQGVVSSACPKPPASSTASPAGQGGSPPRSPTPSSSVSTPAA